MKKKQLTVPRSELILDAAPGVLRAHTIADVLRALARHDALTWSTGARDAVAEELNVPALWLDAAVGEQHHNPTVTLDLLHEWADWKARVMPGKAAA